MAGPVLEVRENERLRLPRKYDNARFRERLLKATAGLPFNVFEMDGRGLRAGGVVGLLEVGGVQLELQPKIEIPPEEDSRQFLIDLLWISGLAPRLFPRAARTSVVAESIPEVLIQAFASDLLQRLRWGAPRRYHDRSEESAVIRGRIDFGRLATRPPGRDQIMPIRAAPLQVNNPLAQLIKATSIRVLGLSRSIRSRRMLRACNAVLSQVDHVPLTAQLVERVLLSRYESDWAPVVALARALVTSQALSPFEGGQNPAVSLLLSLEDVFEGLLRLMIPEALSADSLELEHQPARLRLLKHETSSRELLGLRPDFVFAVGGDRVAVGDAKWKSLADRSPGFGLRAADTYQLATYMARHGLDRGILFFPKQPWMGGHWSQGYQLVGGTAGLRLVGVDFVGLASRSGERHAAALHSLREAITLSVNGVIPSGSG